MKKETFLYPVGKMRKKDLLPVRQALALEPPPGTRTESLTDLSPRVFVVPGNVGYNPYEFEKARLDSAENLV